MAASSENFETTDSRYYIDQAHIETHAKYFDQKSGKSAFIRSSLFTTLREQYPSYHIVSVNPRSADFVGYAAAGKAKSSLDITDGYMEREREYSPPERMRPGYVDQQEDKGSLSERVWFGRFDYKWRGSNFWIYRISFAENIYGELKFWYFVLYPRTDDCQTGKDQKIRFVPGLDSTGAEEDEDEQDEKCVKCSGQNDNCPEIDDLILNVGQWTSIPHNQVQIFDNGYWSPSSAMWDSVKNTSWDDVILDPQLKSGLMADVEGFFLSRTLYQRYGVPWKRGIILHGHPGNGKTLSIKALTAHLARMQPNPIPTLYVKSMVNKCKGDQVSIKEVFQYARRSAPCLLIFEDLDSMVTDEVRSFFLNEVDGLDSNDGILMIASTNHLNKLDVAITKRPSRFDRKYAYRLPALAERHAYVEYWRKKLNDNDDVDFPPTVSDIVAKLTDGFSYAYLKELFITSLLAFAKSRLGHGPIGDDQEGKPNGENGWDVVSNQSGEEAGHDAEKKEGKVADDEDKEERRRREVPTVEIPEELKENGLLKVIILQATALLQDMDDSEAEERKKEDEQNKNKEDEGNKKNGDVKAKDEDKEEKK